MIKGTNWGIWAGGIGLLLSNFIKDPDKQKAVRRGANQLLQIGASMKAGKGGKDAAPTQTPSGVPVQPGQHPIKPPPPVKPDKTLSQELAIKAPSPKPAGTPPTNNGMNTVNPNAPKLQINSKGMVDLRGTPAPGYEESKEYPGLYAIQDRKKPLW